MVGDGAWANGTGPVVSGTIFRIPLEASDAPPLTYFKAQNRYRDLAISPDGRAMRVPQRFRWSSRDDQGSTRLELEGRVDTPFTYGLGSESQNLPAYIVMSTGAGISGGAAAGPRRYDDAAS